MILTNVEQVPGKRIVEHYGIVTGSTVRAKHVGKDILAGLKNIVGGEIKGYTELLQDARNEAMERLKAQAEDAAILSNHSEYIETLGKTEKPEIGAAIPRPAVAASSVVEGIEIFLPLDQLIDVDKETSRLSKEIERLSQQLHLSEKKLANEDFLKKAKKDVVERERQKAALLLENKQKLEKNLLALQK